MLTHHFFSQGIQNELQKVTTKEQAVVMRALLNAQDFDSILDGSASKVSGSDGGLGAAVQQLLEKAAEKPTREPIPNLLQILESFAEIVRDAKKNAKVAPFVDRAVDLFLADEPSTWKNNFAQMDPFCEFLKYVEREDLSLAWKQVRALNRETIEQQFTRRDGTHLVARVDGRELREIDIFNAIVQRAQDLYTQPFVQSSECIGDEAGPKAWEQLRREAEALLRGDFERGRLPLINSHGQVSQTAVPFDSTAPSIVKALSAVSVPNNPDRYNHARLALTDCRVFLLLLYPELYSCFSYSELYSCSSCIPNCD
jgi:hypothetical protein